MSVEQLTYADLAERLKITPEAARSLVKRLHLPRQRANDGRTLVAVDLAEIQHKPLPARSPAGHQGGAAALKAQVGHLQAQLVQLDARSTGHRADYERERDRAERLMVELLKATGDTMAARETAARLEGEITALRSRPWWQRLVG